MSVLKSYKPQLRGSVNSQVAAVAASGALSIACQMGSADPAEANFRARLSQLTVAYEDLRALKANWLSTRGEIPLERLTELHGALKSMPSAAPETSLEDAPMAVTRIRACQNVLAPLLAAPCGYELELAAERIGSTHGTVVISRARPSERQEPICSDLAECVSVACLDAPIRLPANGARHVGARYRALTQPTRVAR